MAPTPIRSRLRAPATVAFAFAAALALAACQAPSGAPSDTTEPSGEPAATASVTTEGATATQECADVQAFVADAQTTLEGLPGKIPGDIPGAITDVTTVVAEFTTLRDSVQDGELRTHLDGLVTLGEEALAILTQAQNGELSTLEVVTQGAAKLAEIQTSLGELNEYCATA